MRYLLVIVVLLALLLATLAYGPSRSAEMAPLAIPAAVKDDSPEQGLQKAVLAGGCFWGVEAAFAHVKGVTKTVAGYSGGDASTATYDQVTTETTGHAESVEVTYDPKQISFGTLLRIFFSVVHDPTQLDRQGPDVGNSYRSEIFATTDSQDQIARAYIAQLGKAKVYAAPIVTKVSRLKAFYPAESYHQNYLAKNPTQPYIVQYDMPKLKALKEMYPTLYRD